MNASMLASLQGTHQLIRKSGTYFDSGVIIDMRKGEYSDEEMGCITIGSDYSITTKEYTLTSVRLTMYKCGAWHFEVPMVQAFNLHLSPAGHISAEYMDESQKWTHSFICSRKNGVSWNNR